MDESIGSFFIILQENMDVQLTSDDEDYILANLDLFELQPININENELAQATRSVQSTEPTANVQPEPTPNIQIVPQEDAVVAQPPEKRFKSLDETELQTLQEMFHQSKSTKNTKWGVNLFKCVFPIVA
jgi:hypothetical protein